MVCPKCGYKKMFDFVICPKCGYNLNEAYNKKQEEINNNIHGNNSPNPNSKYIAIVSSVSRKSIIIRCIIGLFVFGWLITMVFEDLGEKGIGWGYFIAMAVFAAIAKQSDPMLFIVVAIIYIIGCIHANVLYSQYKTLAKSNESK